MKVIDTNETKRTSELNQIASIADDITEPECMERVMMYLEQLKEEDEDYMQLLVEKLPYMIVTWEQPWYQQATSLTRPCRETNEDDQDSYLTDTMSKEEYDQIERNWSKFIKKYKVPDTPICFARWRNTEKARNRNMPEERARNFVTSYLARGLKRNLHQVYRHILAHYGSPVKGTYSETEEKIMEICFHHVPSKAVTYLTAVLGRDPRGIYKRLHHTFNGKPIKKPFQRWSLPRASKLVNLLIKHSGLSLDELKNETIDKSVWLNVENDMETEFNCLQEFWFKTLYTLLFIKFDVKLHRLKKNILKKLRLFPYQVWGDIRWKKIRQLFPDGFTHYFLYKVCYHTVRKYPNYRNAPLEDIINYCLGRIKKHGRNRRLKTLALDKDGNLEIVKYNERIKYT